MKTTENTSTNAINNEQPTLIAKLMAMENINVSFDYVRTAHFDLDSRELVIPIYEGLSPEMYKMMVAHEVSHALHTPLQDWSDFVGTDKEKHQYANILEDVRIEKLIKRRYPGVTREMKDGYKDIHEKDFFGIGDTDLSSFSLIDRINLHFKSYGHINVPFSSEELSWLTKAAATETFEDVKNLTNELYEAAKEPEQEPEQGNDSDNDDSENDDSENNEDIETGDNGDFGDSDSDATDDNLDDFNVDSEGDGDGDSENDDDASSSTESEGIDDSGDDTAEARNPEPGQGQEDSADSGPAPKSESGPEPVTQDNFDSAMADNHAAENMLGNAIPTATLVNDVLDNNWKDLIISTEDVLARERDNLTSADIEELFTNYRTLNQKNRKVVNHMVKEFEMKKSAAAQKRSMSSKTGNIDMDRLYKYQTSDDIFLREETLPEGKNHGVVMYVDFSGSMAGPRVENSMAQIFNMVMFCSKVGIPYRVFAFTNNVNLSYQNDFRNRGSSYNYKGINDYLNAPDYLKVSRKIEEQRRVANQKGFTFNNENDFRLLTLVSNEQNKNDWLFSMGLIATVTNPGNFSSYNIFHRHSGGTPLNLSLYIAPYIINDFTKAYGIDKTIFLLYTDGGASDYMVINTNGRNLTRVDSSRYITDPRFRKTWSCDTVRRYTRRGVMVTQMILTDRISAATNAKIMAFSVISEKDGGSAQYDIKKMETGMGMTMDDDYSNYQTVKKTFKTEGFLNSTKAWPYDSFTFISQKSTVDNYDIDDELKGKDATEASTKQLQGAFLRSNRKTNDSRFLTKTVMETIA